MLFKFKYTYVLKMNTSRIPFIENRHKMSCALNGFMVGKVIYLDKNLKWVQCNRSQDTYLRK